MKNIDIIANPGAEHQQAAAYALKRGLARHGVNARVLHSALYATARVVACWGWRNGAQVKARGHDVLVLERGFVGDRFQWTSIHWNGLNGRGRFHDPADGGDRWRRVFAPIVQVDPPRPEFEPGAPIVIMGQVPGDASLQPIGGTGRVGATRVRAWYESLAKQLEMKWGGDVWFRPHPLAADLRWLPQGVAIFERGLADALAYAGGVVAFNSNSLTDAALAGVPIAAADPGAITWPIAGQGQLAKPVLHDRANWLNAVAWRQWSRTEIENGSAWDCVQHARGQEAEAGT